MTKPIDASPVRSRDSNDQDRGDALLEVRDSSVDYAAGTRAINGASLDIRPGERVAIVGESGSGKSTLALAVAGFLRADELAAVEGTITFEGRVQTPAQAHRIPSRTPGISMVFQDAMTSLDPVWSIGSQLRAVLKADGSTPRRELDAAARDWLIRVGLHDTERVMKSRPYELSGGMRQRVMIALSLCGRPRLLIADEPTSALDASLARGTMDLLVELVEATGVSLLIVSHDIHLCLEYADSLVVMYRGDVVEQGPSRLLAQHADHPYTQGLLHCVPTLENASSEELPTLASFMAATGGPASGSSTGQPAKELAR
ncbi:ABC transporter ATP-binding protein [Agromyces silvae]|uniref:ABC transporter ATP-binding protein n=1 Tax=Agromyces silvae TaxID=3388266 RepID=UPI00280ADD93|nr:ABC transporter ATP-binding protein [Agromyces protaetiae]